MKHARSPLRRHVLATLLTLPWAARAAAPADAILGTWLTDDGASKVEVTATKAADGNSVYNGKVVWLKEPLRDGQPLRDTNNADAALRSRPIIGLVVLSGFKAVGSGYDGGTIYSPRGGKTYPADLAITADGRLELKVKAGLLTKTDYWTR
jgi:uncharacterized protein (DUF2147 family)